MIVSYCQTCLPNKIVLGYSEQIADLRKPHNTHPQKKKNGWMALSMKEWNSVVVQGDDTQTKANIVAQFGSKFVSKG